MKQLNEYLVGVNESRNIKYSAIATLPGMTNNVEAEIIITSDNPQDKKDIEEWLENLFRDGYVGVYSEI